MSAGPSTWSPEQIRLLHQLWPTGMTLREMSPLLGHCKSAISEMAHKKGFPPRQQPKYGIPKNIAGSIKPPKLVTRRCEDCSGHWVTTAGKYEHPDCPRRRQAA